MDPWIRFKNKCHCMGNMNQYYAIKKWCECKEDAIDEANRPSILKRKYENIIKLYTKFISYIPFENEKKQAIERIWDAVMAVDGELLNLFPNEVEYIKKTGKIMLYPYEFVEKYNSCKVNVISANNTLSYILHKNRKLYFPKNKHDIIKKQYLQLITEQDKLSPHRYFDDEMNLRCDIFVDVGSAEGMIALENVNNADELYLLECSECWISALETTFQPYKDKVHIIKKYAGSYNDKHVVTLDKLLKGYKNKKIIIKMDIEGMEIDALKGCVNTMKNNDCYFSCATYHTNTDYEKMSEFFNTNNYSSSPSIGYMLFFYGNMALRNGKYQRMEFPFFRHGIIRAKKRKREL